MSTLQIVHVVQGFVAGRRGGLVPGRQFICKTEHDAVNKAAALSGSYAGVLAYTQAADQDLGDYDEPRIIASHGTVPEID